MGGRARRDRRARRRQCSSGSRSSALVWMNGSMNIECMMPLPGTGGCIPGTRAAVAESRQRGRPLRPDEPGMRCPRCETADLAGAHQARANRTEHPKLPHCTRSSLQPCPHSGPAITGCGRDYDAWRSSRSLAGQLSLDRCLVLPGVSRRRSARQGIRTRGGTGTAGTVLLPPLLAGGPPPSW